MPYRKLARGDCHPPEFLTFFACPSSRQYPNLAGSSGPAEQKTEATPYCLTQPPTSGLTKLHKGTASENGTFALPPLELQPCPGLPTNLTVVDSQLFYFNCQSCDGSESHSCQLESYLYVKKCLDIVQKDGEDQQSLLQLMDCDAELKTRSTQVSSSRSFHTMIKGCVSIPMLM